MFANIMIGMLASYVVGCVIVEVIEFLFDKEFERDMEEEYNQWHRRSID